LAKRKSKSTSTSTSTRRPKSQSFSPGRRKSCNFCRAKIDHIDYKDFQSLRRFLSDKGKIRSRRITGACRRHQSQLAEAVKQARELAFLPYVSER
jgi:small subunit ribosomal protein S18